MRSRRPVITLALFVLAICCVISASADAGSLLSGYGGPGEGNQTILGSSLINGPTGKGGPGGGPGGSASDAAQLGAGSGSLAAPSGRPADSAKATPDAAAGPGASRRASESSRSTSGFGAGKASAGGSQPYRRATGTPGGGASQALGLSSADLLYILLALGILAVTGILTRRLARHPVSG
ncbi:MAG: hypothetical protein ACRDJX_09930 [Solirubrobacteraceae bacterium]